MTFSSELMSAKCISTTTTIKYVPVCSCYGVQRKCQDSSKKKLTYLYTNNILVRKKQRPQWKCMGKVKMTFFFFFFFFNANFYLCRSFLFQLEWITSKLDFEHFFKKWLSKLTVWIKTGKDKIYIYIYIYIWREWMWDMNIEVRRWLG